MSHFFKCTVLHQAVVKLWYIVIPGKVGKTRVSRENTRSSAFELTNSQIRTFAKSYSCVGSVGHPVPKQKRRFQIALCSQGCWMAGDLNSQMRMKTYDIRVAKYVSNFKAYRHFNLTTVAKCRSRYHFVILTITQCHWSIYTL